MKVDRQIAAESRQKFHTLPYLSTKVTGLMCTKFLRYIAALLPLLTRALQGDTASVSERQSKEWKQSISTSAKVPIINWLT